MSNNAYSCPQLPCCTRELTRGASDCTLVIRGSHKLVDGQQVSSDITKEGMLAYVRWPYRILGSRIEPFQKQWTNSGFQNSKSGSARHLIPVLGRHNCRRTRISGCSEQLYADARVPTALRLTLASYSALGLNIHGRGYNPEIGIRSRPLRM